MCCALSTDSEYSSPFMLCISPVKLSIKVSIIPLLAHALPSYKYLLSPTIKVKSPPYCLATLFWQAAHHAVAISVSNYCLLATDNFCFSLGILLLLCLHFTHTEPVLYT